MRRLSLITSCKGSFSPCSRCRRRLDGADLRREAALQAVRLQEELREVARVPISLGTVPAMELSKANSCRTVDRWPSCDGTVPERSLELRRNLRRCDSLPIWWMAPVRLLE